MSEHDGPVRLFDLNIEEVLEHWEVEHALREIIANALDEQYLSGSADIAIYVDEGGGWHIRDHGRGLQIEHFTQNENQEKVESESSVIGKFGVGLKDALATLHRHRIEVTIRSPFGTFRPREARKHDFDAITTLHVEHDPAPAGPGTDFLLEGVTDSDIEAAKSLFLHFNEDTSLDSTIYGQVLTHPSGAPRVYINGVLANEEPNFLFSYNITSLTPAMKKRLNRERTNVGRTTYAERVKAILRTAESDDVCGALANQVGARARGDQCDEMQWAEVAQRALNLLHHRGRVTFVTETQLEQAPDVINHMRGDGYDVVVVSDAHNEKLDDRYRAGDTDLRTFEGYITEFNDSFEYEFVEPELLNHPERVIYERTAEILALIAVSTGLPVRISETMRVGLDNTNGVWDRELREIIIARRQLSSLDQYAGTLLHEAAHATTSTVDVSRAFESVLTDYVGRLAARHLKELDGRASALTTTRTTDTTADVGEAVDPYIARCRMSGWTEYKSTREHLELLYYRRGDHSSASRLAALHQVLAQELHQLAERTAQTATDLLRTEAEKIQRSEPVSTQSIWAWLTAEPINIDETPGSIGIVRRDQLDRDVPGWAQDGLVQRCVALVEPRIGTIWRGAIESVVQRHDVAEQALLAEASGAWSAQTAGAQDRETRPSGNGRS